MKNELLKNKSLLKINSFQIENMKINSVYVNNKQLKNEKYFYEFGTNEKEIIDIKIEIELIPFGKFEFEEKDCFENTTTIKRFLDKDGNIVFPINSIFL